MLWFFTYQFTVWPVLTIIPVFAMLGALVPFIGYRIMAKNSIIERLREAEA